MLDKGYPYQCLRLEDFYLGATRMNNQKVGKGNIFMYLAES